MKKLILSTAAVLMLIGLVGCGEAELPYCDDQLKDIGTECQEKR